MKEMICDKTRKVHGLITILRVVTLALIMLINIAGAAPFAYITNCANDVVSVIDISTNKVIATVPVGNSPEGVTVSPDGTKVYVTNYQDNTTSVIDTATNTVIANVNGFFSPTGVAVSPDGTKLYVANQNDDTVSVIDTSTNNVIAMPDVGSSPTGIAVSPDGTKVYVANFDNNTTSVIDTATNKVTATFNVGIEPWEVAVSPDGTKVYVTNYGDNTTSVIDTVTNTVSATINQVIGPWGVSVAPNGKKVYVANQDDDTVSVIDTETNSVTATVPVGSSPTGIAVSPDGRKVYVANFDNNSTSVIDTTTNKVTATLDVGIGPSEIAIGKLINAVQPAYPVNFNINVTKGYVPLSVQFTGLSENATAWNWDFGDGGTSIKQNPTHTYSTAGIYTVNLTVSNAKGTTSKTAMIEVQKENGSPVNFNINVTKGYMPLSVQFTGLSENATAWNWDFGDGTNSSEKNATHTYSTAGIYTVNLTVSNAKGTTSKTATIEVQKENGSSDSSNDESSNESSHSSHSSSGGNGGLTSGSPEPQSNVEVKEVSQTFIASEKFVNFDFPKNVTPVMNISFESKKTVGKTTAIVEMLKNQSTLVSEPPSDEIYKFINIWVGNSEFATPDNIENAVINFRVEKSWIKDKNIDKSSINLNRYSGKKWEQPTTDLLSEDDKYLYFTAETPGFSPFAITGKIAANETETYPAAPNEIQSSKRNKNIADFEIIYGIICLIAVFLYKRK